MQCMTKFAQMHSNPEEEREGEKGTSRGVQELFYENRGDRRASDKDSDRRREVGWQMVTS